MDFLIGGVSSCGACILTNPLEVVKIRMQLQGELNSSKGKSVRYKNLLQAGKEIAKSEGLLALQKGLLAALYYQFIFNSIRLGAYQILYNNSIQKSEGKHNFIKNSLCASLGGCAGTFFSSPFYLIKTKLQSNVASTEFTVLEALKRIYKRFGIPGLFRGAMSAMPRTTVGSSASLVSFSYSKAWMAKNEFTDSEFGVTFYSGLIAGFSSSFAIAPFDLICIRLYNQGALAATGACCFSNPLEVIKVRMQLQGELQAKGSHPVYYKNILNASYMIAKHDGLLALQSGLIPALLYQVSTNTIRLGTYQKLDRLGYTRNNEGNFIILKGATCSVFCGLIGALVGSPFFLIKTQLQGRSAIGKMTEKIESSGMIGIAKKIYTEHGIFGLFRGTTSFMPRTAAGSGVQLTSFFYCKEFLEVVSHNHPFLATFLASMVSGFLTTGIVTPLDLIAIRIYNQGVDSNGRGLLYKGYADCAYKIYRSEGVFAFYKGFGAAYFRLGPHTVFTLVFWDQLKRYYEHFNRR